MGKFNNVLSSAVMLGCLLAGAVSASAEETKSSSDWKFGVEAYLWGAGVRGHAADGSSVKISFNEIWDDLQLGAMTTLSARKDEWNFFGDFIYLDLEKDTSGDDIELKGFITTLGAGYKVYETEIFEFTPLVGARYLYLDVDLSVPGFSGSDDGDVWDGVVGFIGQANIGDNWYLKLYSDVGTGESDYTWQVQTSVHYRFGFADAVVGYRYLKWQLDGDVIDDLNFSGPFAGLKFNF